MGSDPMIKKKQQAKSRRFGATSSPSPSSNSSRDAALRAAERDTQILTQQPTRDITPSVSTSATMHSTQPVTPKARPAQKSKPACHKFFCFICVALGLLVLSAGGVAIWYFCFHHQPEKVMLDALNQLGQADAVVLQGSASIMSRTDNQTVADIDFVSTPDTPGMVSADLSLHLPTSAQDNTSATTIQLQLNSVADQDGITYLQIGGLTQLLEDIPTAELSPEELTVIETYQAMLETIDNEWWQISIPDLINQLELEPTSTQAFQDFYGCLWDLAQTDYRALFAALYQQHPFLQISENPTSTDAGYTSYLATVDFEQLADFLNQIPVTDAAEAYFACYNDISGIEDTLSATDFDELTAEELSADFPDDLAIEFEISNLSHQLRQFRLEWPLNEQFTLQLEAEVAYQSAIITIPDAYRPVTDLIDELSEFTVYLLGYSYSSTQPEIIDQSLDIIIDEENYEPLY